MNSPKQSASESKAIKDLEGEIAVFTQEIQSATSRVRELLASEDLENGVYFHQEIFTLKQDTMRMKTEIIFRKNKINRLLLTH